jgi:PH (Pleckstrin Homology) domain-containing protein
VDNENETEDPDPGSRLDLPPGVPDAGAGAQARFVPDRRYTAIAAAGALGAALAVLISDDAGGRLLLGIAAVLLLGYVVSDLFFSPRLVASASGLVINAPLTRARLSWDEVHDVRADTRIRHGLRSTTLEIDAGSVLAVLSRRALGAEPVDAAQLIEAFRPQ